MVEFLSSPEAARKWCQSRRSNNQTIGYVPTMGALHQGHLSLIHQAVKDNDLCCASIFVNPLQFNNPVDLENYPSTLEQDIADFQEAGCDMVYTGTLEQFFPGTMADEIIRLDPGPAANGLEDTCRPGHLQGVITIVDRLFRTVGDCHAYFGEKDFQQTLVIKHLSNMLLKENIQIGMVVCPTVRESSGLAMSSRNQRLTDQEKKLAANIYLALQKAKTAWQNRNHSARSIETIIKKALDISGIDLQYASIRDEDNWSVGTPDYPCSKPRALVAATIGAVRLIDNLSLLAE